MTEKPKSKRGGYRENGPVGKPIHESGSMSLFHVRLTDEQIEKAKRLGDGISAKGIRKALDEYKMPDC
jgi:hypothetical protein